MHKKCSKQGHVSCTGFSKACCGTDNKNNFCAVSNSKSTLWQQVFVYIDPAVWLSGLIFNHRGSFIALCNETLRFSETGKLQQALFSSLSDWSSLDIKGYLKG
jgi:hypothetical protein